MIDRKQRQAFKQMVEAVSTEAYKKVGAKLVAESKAQQKEINDSLCAKLEDWDKIVRDRVRDIIDKELVDKIHKVVKLELAKNK